MGACAFPVSSRACHYLLENWYIIPVEKADDRSKLRGQARRECGNEKQIQDHITTQSFSFGPLSSPDLLIFPFLAGPTSMGVPPLAAARIAARRCRARSSPASAALTYHTLASRGSRRHPMPISVKYPTAYSAFVSPDLGVSIIDERLKG